MKHKPWAGIFVLLIIAGAFLTACSLKIDRNPDGSLTVQSSMAETALQAEIAAAIADPLIQEFKVELKNGHILVRAERRRLQSKVTDEMSFRLDLGVEKGHLTTKISNAKINGLPIDQARIDLWNQRIATRLERAAKRNPNTTLENVTVTDDAVEMTWRVETARSQS